MAPDARLPRDFFARDPLEVAPELLGRHLSFGGVTVRLTEVEAYAGGLDPGSHAFRGPTPRTAPMFGPAGFTYVYFTYGNHWCVNLVVGHEGTAAAVLLRGAQVVGGEEIVRARRGPVRDRDLTRGPGRLGQALALSKEHSGRDFCRPAVGDPIDLCVSAGERADPALVRTGPRVGVSGPGGDATAYPWRYWVEGEPSVSTYRPGVVGRPRS